MNIEELKKRVEAGDTEAMCDLALTSFKKRRDEENTTLICFVYQQCSNACIPMIGRLQ